MYKTYLILINDYLLTARKDLMFDLFLPFLISLVLGALLLLGVVIVDKNIIINVTTVLGILAGFSVTAVTILTSANSDNINNLKNRMLPFLVDNVSISYFRKHYILISYSVLSCLIVIILNTVAFLVPWSKYFLKETVVIFKAIDLFLILHIFLLNIRNITSLYFIYFDDTNISN